MKKKKAPALMAGWLAAILTLTGCVRIAPLRPENTPDGNPVESVLTAAGPTVAEVLCAGVYADPTEDCGTETARFLCVGGLLLCEADQEFAAYYAEEIVPDDPAMLSLPADGAPDIPVTIRRFSGFSMMGEYWDEGERYRMRLTEDGVLFVSGDGGEDYARTLAPDASPVRTADWARSALEGQYGPASIPDGLPGRWTDEGENRLLLIREDGGFLFVLQEAEHPPRVFSGACCADGNGRLRCLTTRTGWAAMPYEGDFAWELTADGALILTSAEPDDPILAAEEAVLYPGDFAAYGFFEEGGS